MMPSRPILRRLLALGAVLPLATVACGPDYEPAELRQATDSIRELYLARDYGTGTRLGEAWAERAPGALELRAWHVHHLSRDDRVEAALMEANELRQRAPEDPWTLFALAGAHLRSDEGGSQTAGLSERALERAPEGRRADFQWLRGEVIREEEGPEAAISYYDGLSREVRSSARFLQRKAVALYQLAGEKDPTVADSLRRRAFELFSEARSRDPSSVEAHFLAGAYLQQRRPEEAFELLREAARLTPAPDVHRQYWRAIWQSRTLEQDEKKRRIRDDIDALLDRRSEDPAALLAASGMLETIGDAERQRELERRIRERFPRTTAAEWALTRRYRRLGDSLYQQRESSGEVDPELERRYEELLVEFLERPKFQNESLRGEAYRELFQLLARRDDVDPDRFRRVVEGLVRYETSNFDIRHVDAPIALVEHTTDYEYAKEIAWKGLASAPGAVNEDRWAFDSSGEMVRAINRSLAMQRDALGWIYFHQDSLERARQEFLLGYERYPDLTRLHYHLGRLYERLDSLDRAQEMYADGAMLQTMGTNPSDTALKRLYRERQGGLEGWREYYTGLSERDARERKREILANRIEDPARPRPFALPTLSGDTTRLSDLTGRVTVLHIWGMWCAPCVAEMPDFQEFYEKYRDHPDVRVVTLDYRDNPDRLEEWMEEKGYTFPVMLDDGYLQGIGHTTYPTTWFLNSDGERVWVKEGASEALAQEFTWRVEALLESRGE